MKTFTMTVTKKDSSTTYTKIDRYIVKDDLLTMIQGVNRTFIIPLNNVIEIDVEKIETKDIPNGEFAGGDDN